MSDYPECTGIKAPARSGGLEIEERTNTSWPFLANTSESALLNSVTSLTELDTWTAGEAVA